MRIALCLAALITAGAGVCQAQSPTTLLCQAEAGPVRANLYAKPDKTRKQSDYELTADPPGSDAAAPGLSNLLGGDFVIFRYARSGPGAEPRFEGLAFFERDDLGWVDVDPPARLDVFVNGVRTAVSAANPWGRPLTSPALASAMDGGGGLVVLRLLDSRGQVLETTYHQVPDREGRRQAFERVDAMLAESLRLFPTSASSPGECGQLDTSGGIGVGVARVPPGLHDSIGYPIHTIEELGAEIDRILGTR